MILLPSHFFRSAYGSVHVGIWRLKDAPTKEVRVKSTQPHASDQEKERLREEAETLGKFFHRNVVELFGVVDHENKVGSYFNC